ncbi:hypothetical protein CG477_016755 [Bacillus cytotoxicus]|uniref:hypothetical protein n=1 Tax=Bacillus cytotoxicus TaxID=580165 RepID=UPI000B970874|nr:hypothetical protein [Bacillus cytotoxicus]AWC45815.1 hypothetical protein CG479_015745 [Bacillus cytotoxicus]AWC53915.1 hypothetical protein CG477_016755 [Bacillus cytotoxicus]AWC58042.1 hypothetical protein CG476_016780 [Bacillus cytotoxicus]AWC66176.1 hypothetical protein CG475_016785 [Bacillus cytotoxicus]
MRKFKKGDRVYFMSYGEKRVGTFDHQDGWKGWCLFDGNDVLTFAAIEDLRLLEEETMKTYTGFEAIERMKTHWITTQEKGCAWKIKEDEIWMRAGDNEGTVNESINFFFKNEFIDYVEPLKFEEGEMYVFESHDNEKWYAVHKEVDGNQYWPSLAVIVAKNFVFDGDGYFTKHDGTFRKPTDEELEEFERFMVFHKKGREMDEFELGDIVEREDALYIVVVQTEDNKFEHVIGCVEINDDDAPVKYFPTNDVELRFCMEDAVG